MTHDKSFELYAYKHVLKILRGSDYKMFLCNELWNVFYNHRFSLRTNTMEETFPLFLKHKPNPNIPNDDPWWKGEDKQSRIKYLEMLIEKLENETEGEL